VGVPHPPASSPTKRGEGESARCELLTHLTQLSEALTPGPSPEEEGRPDAANWEVSLRQEKAVNRCLGLEVPLLREREAFRMGNYFRVHSRLQGQLDAQLGQTHPRSEDFKQMTFSPSFVEVSCLSKLKAMWRKTAKFWPSDWRGYAGNLHERRHRLPSARHFQFASGHERR